MSLEACNEMRNSTEYIEPMISEIHQYQLQSGSINNTLIHTSNYKCTLLSISMRQKAREIKGIMTHHDAGS